MTTMSNDEKAICFALSDVIIRSSKESGDLEYKVILPKVSCTNENDAEYIQQEMNNLVYKLCRKLIRGGK